MADELVYTGRFPARAERLKEIRAAVREAAEACGCGPGCAQDMVIAVDEACQNIIRHGYAGDPQGSIELRIEHSGESLVFSLRDWARPVDPAEVKPRDLDDLRPGGLGTHLMREAMDECEFVEPPPGCSNLLRMVKRIQ